MSPHRKPIVRGMHNVRVINRIGAYLRVSSRSQDWSTQLHAIESAATARGDRVDPILTYSEKASAKTADRPMLARLRAAAKAGELRKVYVYKLDRLVRSGVRDMLTVLDELKAHGCQVVTVADGFDLEGPAGELVVMVLAWAAKQERIVINERIAAARTRVEAEGGAWGRPTTLGPRLRERASAMRDKGKTFRAIAIALKVPKSTIARALAELKGDEKC
jgi:DNA invertase Pin-like site-specific DNA recombinase